jgi:prophage regulatory protein
MSAYTQLHPNTDSYLRVHQIVGCRKRGIPPRIPISRSSWFSGVRSGKFPAGRLLGPRTRVWLASDIAALIAQGTEVQP